MKRTTPRCPECRKRYLKPVTTALTGATHGESFNIISDALSCANCGFKTIPADKMGEFALRIADAYREKHGLLTSSQIKDCRLNLGMSQQQFASHLGVGSSSVKRWELGYIQDKAMNDLILLRTDAGTAEANAAEVLTRLGMPVSAAVWLPLPKQNLGGKYGGLLWECKDSPGHYGSSSWDYVEQKKTSTAEVLQEFNEDYDDRENAASLGLVA